VHPGSLGQAHRSGSLRVLLGVLLAASPVLAGPPFTTDDPEPVEYRHWELYLATQDSRDVDGWSGTVPHFEVNYGVVPEVQLHLLVPLSYSAPGGANAHYGYGDTEVGAKVRFVGEGRWVPQVGVFPLLELATGNARRGLGNGSTQAFVPLWIQKSFAEWTTYGGLGAWLDGQEPRDVGWFFGWLLQRRLGEVVTVGAELYHTTPRASGGDADTAFNVGSVVDLGDVHHVLMSAGRSIAGPTRFQCYAAWLVTLGPHDI
jgi:hypothetical protein